MRSRSNRDLAKGFVKGTEREENELTFQSPFAPGVPYASHHARVYPLYQALLANSYVETLHWINLPH